MNRVMRLFSITFPVERLATPAIAILSGQPPQPIEMPAYGTWSI